MEACKSLEFVQTPGGIERFGVKLDASMGGIDARTTAGTFLGVARVRRTVGPQEKSRIARSGRLDERQPVFFAFQDRQTVVVGADAASEEFISIHQEVVRCNRCGHVVARAEHEFHSIGRRDVLHYDAQSRQPLNQGNHSALDENFFAIEDIDLRVGDFAMYQQGNSRFRHGFERLDAFLDVGYAGIGIRGCARGVVLHRAYNAARPGLVYFSRLGVIRKVKRHQRLEIAAGDDRSRCLGVSRSHRFGFAARQRFRAVDDALPDG